LGHNLGLLHAGGLQDGNYVEYGDPQAAMGASYRYSSFIAAARFHLGFLRERDGEVVDWSNGAGKSLTLGTISRNLGASGEQAVAIKIKCPRCVPKVLQHRGKVGGFIWISFRGDEGYSAVELDKKYQNKVYVHLMRQFTNPRANQGSELWAVLDAGKSYKLEYLPYTIYVCSIKGDLTKVSIGKDAKEAKGKCSQDPWGKTCVVKANTDDNEGPLNALAKVSAPSSSKCAEKCSRKQGCKYAIHVARTCYLKKGKRTLRERKGYTYVTPC